MMFCVHAVYCQEDILQSTRLQVDSILQKIAMEKDPVNRFDLFLTLYDTPLEGYPLLELETSQKLLLIAHKSNDIIAESNAFSMAGQGYRLSGNYIKGLEYHHKAIALAEKSGNLSVLSWAQIEMAHIYKDRQENEKAISLYTAAMGNAREGKIEWIAMMNIAAVFLATNQLDSSLFYSKLAYEKAQDLKGGNKAQAGYLFMNMASAYSKLGNNTKALEYFTKAINASRSIRFRTLTYEALAEHFERNKKIDSCTYYAKKAIEIAQNSIFSYEAMKPSKLLTDIYENSNADSTLKYLKIYRAANDSFFNARNNQQFQMMTFEEDQRQRDAAAEKIAYQNKIKTNLMLGGIAVFLLIALILFRNNVLRKKANEVLESTLSNLKSTQSQLIQSEKMASLGELTAGIAHEIQNPLNFVNNFSDVNQELLVEMKDEMKKGNIEEADSLANDVIENEQKINHHGKRADAIVKGMLQHSRQSSGHKEPTDINALADEYLRLSYHGLRAKDKTFNAEIKTDFDGTIGKINIIPQDIGRVLLNLFNNAFYAVSERQKAAGGKLNAERDYQPSVFVTTMQCDDKIQIIVKDNGNGIPQKIVDKIFQPFFTTKPTGEGTGLGLSLAYDIIKVHGGTLKVESKDGEGSEFIIQLPVV